jgi:enoyl-CoA hydratase/carnithine racemase
MGVLGIEDADGVRVLTLNRPDALNAFNDELWDATRDALVEAQGRDDLGCVVLTGAGRAFTAGQDLGEMAAPPSHANGELHGYRGFIPVLEEFDKPLIAAVNGIGVGIGITVLGYCDLVVMGESARLKAPFVSLGVTTEAAGSVSLPARMGWAAAAHVIFTGGWLSAADALACGLAWRVTPDGQLLDETMAVARVIGAQPVGALTATKRLMVAGRLDAWRAARVREDSEFVRLVGAPENLAALEAFFNKGS